MPPQRMALRKGRVVEIVCRGSCHPDSLHDGSRTPVRRDREGHDFFQSEAPETELDDGAVGLRGIAVAPVVVRQAPADLDAGREVCLEMWFRQADEPYELVGAG